MNKAMAMMLALFAGSALGAVFFGGLWWTVRKGLASTGPAWWFLASLVLRTGIVLTGFYFVGGGQAERLAACLLGFIVARPVVTRLTRAPADREGRSSSTKEVNHAP